MPSLLWNAERREAEMDKRCILFTGLQASGKTTFWQQRYPDLVHVNLDTLHTRNKERQLLEDCFSSGTSFVVDNTNPTRKTGKDILFRQRRTVTGLSDTISSHPFLPAKNET